MGDGMNFDQLIRALDNVTGVWGLSAIGIPNLKSGLNDALNRIRALERKVAISIEVDGKLEARLKALEEAQPQVSASKRRRKK
jgi:hypothetical protein